MIDIFNKDEYNHFDIEISHINRSTVHVQNNLKDKDVLESISQFDISSKKPFGVCIVGSDDYNNEYNIYVPLSAFELLFNIANEKNLNDAKAILKHLSEGKHMV